MDTAVIAHDDGAGEDRSAFRDATSGCTFLLGTPPTHPSLWRHYLDGALRTYRHFGAEAALDHDTIADGSATSMFVAGMDRAGRVVSGVRIQGPYRRPEEAHVLAEWRGHDGEAELRRAIAARLTDGVAEVKSAWVARDAPQRPLVRAAVGRGIVHMTTSLGVRYTVGSADRRLASRWRDIGAVVDRRIPAIPYPDDRYRTEVIWWDMTSWRATADATQVTLIDAERTAMTTTTRKAAGS